MKVFKFNELMANTYRSYIDKVKGYDDPRHKKSSKLASDSMVKKYTNGNFLCFSASDESESFLFNLFEIQLPHPKLLYLSGTGELETSQITSEQVNVIVYHIDKNIIYYNTNQPDFVHKTLNADRKTANIIYNILKDFDININKRDIPQF